MLLLLTRLLSSLAGVSLITWVAYRVMPVNATTVAFAYLLFVLCLATVWGFIEASLASVAATFTFNLFFLPPVGKLTIADPQNWVALFSFLATSLVASRLSTQAKQRALDATARTQDVERLYTFSRGILLIGERESFPKQLVNKVADIFNLAAVVLYDRRSDAFYRAGPSDFEGLDDQLRDAALQGTSFADPEHNRVVTAVRLGADPIAGLALQGARMPDSVLQGIANLVAIGLERARAQDLAAQVEAAKHSEKLRTTLLDALAHEFKTPLTSVIGATTALLDDPDQPLSRRVELLKIADEEGHHLQELIDDTVEMGRLDRAEIAVVDVEWCNLAEIVGEVVTSMHTEIDDRIVQVVSGDGPLHIAVDRRLMKLAIKQLLGNAMKYSPPHEPVVLEIKNDDDRVTLAVTDHGAGIPVQEQSRIFERLYRGPSVERQIPGSGLGLSIALNIVRAHHGDLTVASRPGQTTFRLTLPRERQGERR